MHNLLPPLVAERTNYNLRNVNDVSIVRRRTELFSKSFIPSTIDFWNTLPLTVRNLQSLEIFKRTLKESYFITIKVPKYYIQGDRRSSVYHARLRNNCSNLNHDLFINHLKPNSFCDCGNDVEDAEHYFFRCERYVEQRLVLFHSTRPFHPLNLNMLLFGSDRLSEMENSELFLDVQQYIKSTRRFE